MRPLFCILGLVAGVAAAQVEVSVAGIRVVGNGYRAEQEDQKFKEGKLRTFNNFAGTSVGLLITSKEKVIVGLDEDASKITIFGDSQGTDFTKAKGLFGRKGAKVVAGIHSFEIDELGKPDWGKDPLSITLTSSVNHKDFKAFKVFDAEGKEIESKRAGSSSMGIFGKRTYGVTFNLKRKVDQIVLGLDGWTDLEKVQVPFDVKIGTGL